MLLGEKIKNARKLKGLSQKELSEGICSQGMLSQIERNKHIPNLMIFVEICNKLDLPLTEMEYQESETAIQLQNELLEYLSQLFYQRKYEEINNTINSHFRKIYLHTKLDQQLLLFYKGLYQGFVKNEYYQAFELLEESLKITYFQDKEHLSLEEYLILNNIGIMMLKLGMVDEGFGYFDLILSTINKSRKIRNESKLTMVFFNIANSYSKLGKYEKSLSVANAGIEWANKPQILTQFRLSYLYYEKAYNEEIIGICSFKESYNIAYHLALNSKDDLLISYINSKNNSFLKY
ncbi:hypothetical protein AEA09_11650 [Lysinibacillus contaminans]|uniref:HTH cro/C1-type domain-containing protein n=1 Tax=Lysinibacillus contaminans TaxID=1293441 RepID=A0ABR5K455_9BACI|nr:helix-turn-helix transcriptional regulator [Lysinibacillus contaminans]KOS69134.1 hypothetical protein AEA09_11650 [Lysinibacillus contaminans]